MLGYTEKIATVRTGGGRAPNSVGRCAGTGVRAVFQAGVTPHALRATHGSWVADKHGVMQAAKRLGHSNANVMTRHYARAIDGHDQAVADDLDTQHRQQRRPAPGSPVARGSHEPADGASQDPAAEV